MVLSAELSELSRESLRWIVVSQTVQYGVLQFMVVNGGYDVAILVIENKNIMLNTRHVARLPIPLSFNQFKLCSERLMLFAHTYILSLYISDYYIFIGIESSPYREVVFGFDALFEINENNVNISSRYIQGNSGNAKIRLTIPTSVSYLI
jgi:uncharacterized protein YjfI (DUF2170 family)